MIGIIKQGVSNGRKGTAMVANRDRPERVISILGQKIGLAGFALLLMLVAIVLPTVMYSWSLQQPTPAELLIAVCIGMFASVLYLWILDASSTINFRSKWISTGVYGAAIVSIMGTSVGVYAEAFGQQPFPFQGEWLLTVQDSAAEKTLISQRSTVLAYSETTGVYWGYSAAPDPLKNGPDTNWVEVTAFDPTSQSVELRIRNSVGLDEVVKATIAETQPRTAFSSATDDKFVISLSRRNE
jgi:hypothetical protein